MLSWSLSKTLWPISKPSFISKILKKEVSEQLLGMLDSNNISDSDACSALLLVELSASFDTAEHTILCPTG